MFTGIVTDIGVVRSLRNQGDMRLKIGTGYDMDRIDLGASISCNGVCLTVVGKGEDSFEVDISSETLSVTNLRNCEKGTRINLECALRVGDDLGGHIVSGHVDGVAEITRLREEGDSLRVSLRTPEEFAKFIAPKGSLALNGVSLTVNEVDNCAFGINLITHTLRNTTWGEAKVGNHVNLEVDTLARYVSRLREFEISN